MVQHEKIKNCREIFYCACSEMVTFAYWFFFYISYHYLWLNCSKLGNQYQNFVQRILFELLCRVYKTPKFGGNVLYECPSIKYVPLKFCSFIHPVLPSLHGYPFAYAFFYPSIPKKIKKIVLLRFLPEKKSFVEIPRFWESRKSWKIRMAVCEAQCLLLSIFWTLVGTIFFTKGQPKRKLKNAWSQTFF